MANRNGLTQTLGVLPVLLLALFVVHIPVASAIGVSPPRAEVTFAPEQRYDYEVTLLNMNDVPVDVDVRVEGILAGSIAVKQPIRIAAKGSTVVPIAVTTPAALPRPGYHTTFVFFAERYIDETSGTFSVRTEVGHRFVMWQPYPGRYAEIVASAPSVARGNDTVLKLVVNNLGTDPIDDAVATVRVVSAEGTLQDVFTFGDVDVAGNSNKDYYQAIPSRSYEPGKYYLQARLVYGANSTETNSSFAVGVQDVDILALEGPLYLDKPVNRFTVHVESLWNQRLDNVYATFELGSGSVQTPIIQLDPFGRGTLTNYWETDRTVPPGQNLAKVTVYFAGGKREALLPIVVYNETPKAPEYEAPAGAGFVELSGADALFILLAIEILAIVILFAVGRWRHERKPPESAQPPAASGTPAPPKAPGA